MVLQVWAVGVGAVAVKIDILFFFFLWVWVFCIKIQTSVGLFWVGVVAFVSHYLLGW